MNTITLVILTLVVFMGAGMSQAADHVYGQVNVGAINTGNLQLKGVVWCKKYFEKCVLSETWSGSTMKERQTVTPNQFVTMQTGITLPQIIDFDDVGGGRYRIIFVYDQTEKHEVWVPKYIEK